MLSMPRSLQPCLRPQAHSYPIRSLDCAPVLLTKSVSQVGKASLYGPFPLALPIARLGPSPSGPSLLAPPILAFCPACRPSSSPIPASGKRGLVSRSPSGSRRREVEAEVAAPAPGVGRSRGCSRSGAAASRGAGAAAAPYCGPKRPRPSHGRDLR